MSSHCIVSSKKYCMRCLNRKGEEGSAIGRQRGPREAGRNSIIIHLQQGDNQDISILWNLNTRKRVFGAIRRRGLGQWMNEAESGILRFFLHSLFQPTSQLFI